MAGRARRRPATRPRPARGPAPRGQRRIDQSWSGRQDYRAKWAVVIGIDRYPGGAARLDPLANAANDARALRDALRDEFGFSDDHIVYLSDGDPPVDPARAAPSLVGLGPPPGGPWAALTAVP